jgi:hypothetical protein
MSVPQNRWVAALALAAGPGIGKSAGDKVHQTLAKN